MALPRTTAAADVFREYSIKTEGRVRSRHHPEYADWHKQTTWNGRSFARYPAYIVKACSEADVVQAVEFARSRRLRISVRGGGHSYSGCFLREGGILLDLSALREISIDTSARRAIVQPGVTSRELSVRLARDNLAFPTGHGSEVAISGFLLGGGLGINCAAWGGMSVFNIKALDVVTADGRVRHISADSEPDLFWAARGGGPALFFAVIRFHLACQPLPRAITSNMYRAPFHKLPSLLTAIRQIQPPAQLQVMLAVIPGGGADQGRDVLLNTIAFADSTTHAKALHGALVSRLPGEWLTAIAEDEPSGFESIYKQSDAMLVSKRYRTDNILTDDAEDAIAILARHLPLQPSAASVPLIVWRGAPTYPDAAYSARGQFFLSTYAQWNDAEDDDINRTWLKGLYDDLAAVASGCYINEFDIETRAAELERCFAPENWRRIGELRRRYDPDGVFQDVATLKPES
ncbi:FAD-binding oxidoreductase [Achromobacter sp. NPDC058515]|uniref:FAD-binding oxidoreductase n=1 Tax=Achromobacter sp. NPDC058515 TaxID=3346533 RepID=UPI00365D79A7